MCDACINRWAVSNARRSISAPLGVGWEPVSPLGRGTHWTTTAILFVYCILRRLYQFFDSSVIEPCKNLVRNIVIPVVTLGT